MELLREIKSGFPELALILGLIVGLLIASIFPFACVRTAFLKSQELRRARDELELRVEELTAELQSINTKLEAEIRERKQTEESLQELSGRFLRLKDEEQRRIARELHDSTAQMLGALTINLEKIHKRVPHVDSLKTENLLEQSIELAERVTAEVRTISYLLHPPILDDLGLEVVLPRYVAGFSDRSGIKVNIDLSPDLGRFSHELELTLFRIVQEALANIHRHSGSPTADITVFRNADRVTLRITDQGRGIPPGILEQARNARVVVGVGIAGMRERVRQLQGDFEIGSADKRTFIEVILPAGGRQPLSEHDNNRAAAEMLKTSSEDPMNGE